MTQDDSEQPPTKPQREYISQRVASVMAAVDAVHNEFNERGQVSEDIRKRLQREVVTCATFFEKMYGDEPTVDMDAVVPGEQGPEVLRKQLFNPAVSESVPEGEHNPQPRRQAQPAQIDFSLLYETALNLLDVSESLGLAPKPSTDDHRPMTHVTTEQ